MSARAITFTSARWVKWASKRVLGLNYKTKLVMCYVSLLLGFYLAVNGKDLVAFSGLAGVVLGIYTAGNVTEATAAMKHGVTKDEG